MVLTSAAATTQTTILPNARTQLSMAFHKALPEIFGRIHPRYLSPSFSTIAFGVAAMIYYIALNFLSHGNVISDAVTATTFFAALYLGITAFACTWHYRSYMREGARRAFSYVIVPLLAGIALFFMIVWSAKVYWNPSESDFTVRWFGLHIGGVLLIVAITTIVGIVWMESTARGRREREYFSGDSMRLGLSLTDDDEVVKIASDPEPPAV